MSIEKKEKLSGFIDPTEQPLWAKLAELNNSLDIIEKHTLDDFQKEILKICREKLDQARECIKPFGKLFRVIPIPKRKYYNIFWNLTHRIDEDIILLIEHNELLAKAIEIKTSFDMNIKERGIREEWLGGNGKKGRLIEAIEELEKGNNNKNIRYIIKELLGIINGRMDDLFLRISLNKKVILCSAILLGIFMVVFWVCNFIPLLGSWEGSLLEKVISISLLGIMGAYLSNFMTTGDFLFIKGSFWIFMLYHIVARPIIGCFAAIFIYILEQSKLVFSIGETMEEQLITLNVSSDVIGYVYAILAIVSGFSGDKIIKNMIDKVLKRLEEKAEKTTETKESP